METYKQLRSMSGWDIWVSFMFRFFVLSNFWLMFPKVTVTPVHVYSATSHGHHPGVHFLLILSWFGYPSQKVPWNHRGGIQHSQDLKIESANKSQDGLLSSFQSKNPPIHALYSNMISKNWHSLHKATSLLAQSGIIWYIVREQSLYLKVIQSHFQRDSCAKFL